MSEINVGAKNINAVATKKGNESDSFKTGEKLYSEYKKQTFVSPEEKNRWLKNNLTSKNDTKMTAGFLKAREADPDKTKNPIVAATEDPKSTIASLKRLGQMAQDSGKLATEATKETIKDAYNSPVGQLIQAYYKHY
jgi:hypothetical protein